MYKGLFLLKLRLNSFLLFIYNAFKRDMEFIIIGQRSVEPIHLYIDIDQTESPIVMFYDLNLTEKKKSPPTSGYSNPIAIC